MELERTRTPTEACKIICDIVGLNFCPSGSGPDYHGVLWDNHVVELAEIVLFNKNDILQRPKRVARAITEYLDDLVKNP